MRFLRLVSILSLIAATLSKLVPGRPGPGKKFREVATVMQVVWDLYETSSIHTVNGNEKCTDFGNSECSIFGIKTTAFLAADCSVQDKESSGDAQVCHRC